MLRFKMIAWSNFLSTGAAGNFLDLGKTRTTLITGPNGSGKSTGVTDALCFVLFNKPFRNINRGQLVNSINNKDCLVIVEFEANGKEYKISRGIKPNIFEIYENGVLFNKESSTRDYQKILETQILKYNFKTFTQVVLLGSASFVPFMTLPKASRREVIEDVLDIGIFSTMNVLLKNEQTALKETLGSMEHDLDIKRERVDAQKKLIQVISHSSESLIKETNDKVLALKTRNDIIVEEVSKAVSEMEALEKTIADEPQVSADKDKANRMIIKIESQINSNMEQSKFLVNNDHCSMCAQDIDNHHKAEITHDIAVKCNELYKKIDILRKALEKFNTRLDEIKKVKTEIYNLNTNKNNLVHENKFNAREIGNLNKFIEEKVKTTNIEEEKIKLRDLRAEGLALIEERDKCEEEFNLRKEALLLLKDNGIKTQIIKEYLPVINKLINQYLEEMDFFCNFEIDEEFNEIIRSRYRDQFSYENFSQGERQRIDIAIMFTFRQIAKMKNSLNTNLLVLDEIFSSSLDQSAVSFLVDMLNSQVDSNVFVVTHHPDEFAEVFDRHLKFQKINNFSVMKEAE